jgi:hypothetical protein
VEQINMAAKPGKGVRENTGNKKPYEAPRIISREKLESVAAVCSGFNSKGPNQPAPDNINVDCGDFGGPIHS